MITLRYPAINTQINEWKETLKDLSLAHKLEADAEVEAQRLSHSGAEYVGSKAITAYLDQLYAEREQWWYCTRDCSTGESEE